MAKRKLQQIIEFEYWPDDMYSKEIPTEHIEQLDQQAEEGIEFWRQKGCTSGELNLEVDEVTYSGWFTFNTKVVE